MKHKHFKPIKPFVNELLKDNEIRILFEEENAKTLIAQAVRSLRLKAGMTQVELAKKAKTTQAALSRIESGEDQRIPTLELLSRIAFACKAKLSFSFLSQKAA